ncbi:MAG: hypothetical protein HUJ68_03395 [Clostridia bacterium]|nr:hypothetical protein [Clostridia bacterium]
MLNVVWPIFIIVSFSYAIFSGNVEYLNSSIFSSTKDAIELVISLLRNYVFVEWNNANCK